MSIAYWVFKSLGENASAVSSRIDFTEKNEAEVSLGRKSQLGVKSCVGGSIEITKVSGAKEFRVIRRGDDGDGEECSSYPVELGIGDSIKLDGQKWGLYKEYVSAGSMNSLADNSDSDLDFSSDSDFDDDSDDNAIEEKSSLITNQSSSSHSMLGIFKRNDDDDEEEEDDDDEEEEEEVGYGFRFTFGKPKEEEVPPPVKELPKEETKEVPIEKNTIKDNNDDDDVIMEPQKEDTKKMDEPKNTYVPPQPKPQPQPQPQPPKQVQQPVAPAPAPVQTQTKRGGGRGGEEEKKRKKEEQQPVAPKVEAPATPKQPVAKVASKSPRSKMADEIREIFPDCKVIDRALELTGYNQERAIEWILNNDLAAGGGDEAPAAAAAADDPDGMVAQLQALFSDVPKDKIRRALAQSGNNLEMAANIILGDF